MERKEIAPYVKKAGLAIGKLILALAFWLFVWFLVSSRIGSELIFPSPKAVFRELGLLMTNRSESLIRYGVQESFWLITAISLLRVLWGC